MAHPSSWMAAALLLTSACLADTPDVPFTHGKAADGATKSAVCSSCHGPNGNSSNPDWPRLAGQNAVYIAEQLRLFRSGARDNPVMKPLAATLQALYLHGDPAHEVPACIACHGAVGRGNLAAGYPALRAQQSAYVLKQLKDYASGARYGGQNPAAASRNGVMMFTIAKRLTPEQMRDVASYLQGMR